MPKIRTYEYGNRQPVVRMIEKVKDLRSEFEIRALRDSSNFRYRCVEVDESRAEKSISVQVAQRAEGCNAKAPGLNQRSCTFLPPGGKLLCPVRSGLSPG